MNLPKQNKDQKGFTIIEVVLVLAIAGLIFLMVFIALPALQRNQRDTQRTNDLGRVTTALQQYKSRNNNKIPASDQWGAFATNYLRVGDQDTFADPSEGDYVFDVKSDRNPPTVLSNQIFVYVGSRCDGEQIVDAGSRIVAFAVKLEGGGVACSSN